MIKNFGVISYYVNFLCLQANKAKIKKERLTIMNHEEFTKELEKLKKAEKISTIKEIRCVFEYPITFISDQLEELTPSEILHEMQTLIYDCILDNLSTIQDNNNIEGENYLNQFKIIQ